MRHILAAVLTGSFLAATGTAQQADVPAHLCKRTTGPITIDGQLDEASWANAKPIPLILRDGSGPPTRTTIGKMCWDDANFYVAFDCADPDIWATMKNFDDPLWREEVVEIFLDPNGTGEPYFEIEINPLNVVVDLRFPGPKYNGFGMRAKEWNAIGMKTAVKVTGKITTARPGGDPNGRWTVEVALPFSALDGAPHLPPADGDLWRANLYRIERPAEEGKGDDEYTCWSPLYEHESYHTRERFGRLIFSMKPVGRD